MFSKAGIKRFNDVKSCAPPPGAYNPKLPEVAAGGGVSFLKADRFPNGQFAVPMTPGSARSECRKYLDSGARGAISENRSRRKRISQSRSNSTFSLPTAFDNINFTPGDEEFVVRRGPMDKNEELKTELNEVQNELDNLRDSLRLRDDENEELHKQLEQVKHDLLSAEARVVQSEKAILASESREKEKDDKLCDQQSKLEAMEACVSAAKHQLTVVQNQKDELQKEHVNMKMQISSQNDQMVALQGEHFAIKCNFNETREHLEAQVKDYQEANIKLQQTLLDYEKERAENASVQSKMAAEYSMLQDKAADLQNDLAVATSNLRKLELDRERLTQVLEEAKLELEDAKSHTIELKQSLRSASYQLEASKNQELHVQADLTNLLDSLRDSEAQKDNLYKQLDAVKAELHDAGDRVKGSEKTVQQMKATEKEKYDLIQSQQLTLSQLQQSHTSSAHQIECLNTENEELNRKIANLYAQSANQSMEISKLSEDLEESLASCTRLDLHVKSQTSKLNELQQELQLALNTTDTERKQFHTAKSLLSSDLDSANANVKTLETELTSLREVFEEVEKDRETLRRALEKAKADLSRVTSHISELEEALLSAESLEVVRDSKISDLESHIEVLETNLSAAKHQSGLIQMSHEDLQNSNNDLCVRNEALTANVVLLKDELNQNQQEFQRLNLQITEQASQLQEYQEKVNQALLDVEAENKARVSIQEQLSSELEMTSQKVLLSEAEVIALKAKLRSVEETRDEIGKHLQDVNENLVSSKARLFELEQSVATKSGQLEVYQHMELQYQSEITSFKETLTKMEEERDGIRRHYEEVKQDLDAASQRIKESEQSLAAAEALCREKDETICCHQSIIDSIEVSLNAANFERGKLQVKTVELQKSHAELLSKNTNQAIEIAQLKDEVDVNNCQVNELKTQLEEQTLKCNESQHERRQVLSLLENERNENSSALSRLTFDLESSQKNLNIASQNGLEWKARYEAAVEEKEKHIQRLKATEVKLADYLDSQLRNAHKEAELGHANVNVLVLKNSLEKLEQQSNASKKKLALAEQEMQKHARASEHWKHLHDQVRAEVQKTHVDRTHSQETIMKQASQIKTLEIQNANLEKLIGPFKEQLKSYKESLDMEHNATAQQAAYAKDIAARYADLVGHQNPKQRIHHMQKLKNDNLTLKNENSHLQKQLKQAQKRVEELEEKYGKYSSRRFDPRQAFTHQVVKVHDPEDTQNFPV